MKILKYIVGALVLFVAVWFSFTTESLKEHNEREAMKQYKPKQKVDYCFAHQMDSLKESAMPLSQFIKELKADPVALQKKSGRVLGIGSNVYYVVKGDAKAVGYTNNEFSFLFDGIKCHIPVKYIFGNVARDASGWFDISTFQNTMDFNSVSACLNKRIKEKIVAPWVKQYKLPYFGCSFCAAIEVKPGQRDITELTLYPYILKMLPFC